MTVRARQQSIGVGLSSRAKAISTISLRRIGLSRGAAFALRAGQLPLLFAICDVLIMSLFLALSFAQSAGADPATARIWRVTDVIFCVSLGYLMVATGGYARRNLIKSAPRVFRILVNAAAAASLEWVLLYSLAAPTPFGWSWSGPLDLVAIGVLCMCLMRLVAQPLLIRSARHGFIVRRVAVVGAGEHGQRLLQAMSDRKEPWIEIVGIFDDRATRVIDSGDGHQVRGNLEDLISYSREYPLDEIIVAFPWSAEARLLSVLNLLKAIPANVHLAPYGIGHHFLDRGYDRLGGVPVYNVFAKPISEWSAVVKRAEDLFLGSLIFLLVMPILLLCAVAVKLDSTGPVLFRQKRCGYNNKTIEVFKFRSMFHTLQDADGERSVQREDKRVTRVGKLLRRTSLDELPQLFNVLRGDMSLVGPRPHATRSKAGGRLFQDVVQEYAARHRVKPGITGWAQVSGWRGETDTEEKIVRRVECDLYYMENWSILLDVKILFRTFTCLLGENAF